MKINTSLFCVFCFLLLTLNNSGQVKLLSKENYEIKQKIYEKTTSELEHRKTILIKTFQNGKLKSNLKRSGELLSEKRQKWTFYEIINGITKLESERFYFDGKRYVRNAGEEWREEIYASGVARRLFKKDRTLEQFTFGKAQFKKKSTDYLSHYRIYKNRDGHLTFFGNRIWINSKGAIIKEEFTRSEFHPANITWRTETTYDYNAKEIRIELPVINKKKP